MSNPGDRLNRVVTSVPRDSVAENVTRAGEHYEHEPGDNAAARVGHSHTPPPMRIAPPELADLIGKKFGRFTVIGAWSGEGKKSKSRMVVRCVCSMYEVRSSKAIRNPANAKDACLRCRRLAFLKRSAYWRATGCDLEAEDLI